MKKADPLSGARIELTIPEGVVDVPDQVRAVMTFNELPAGIRQMLAAFANTLLKRAQREQVPPEQLLAGLAALSAAIVLTNRDVRDEAVINSRIWFADDALHGMVAVMRHRAGVRGDGDVFNG